MSKMIALIPVALLAFACGGGETTPEAAAPEAPAEAAPPAADTAAPADEAAPEAPADGASDSAAPAPAEGGDAAPAQ